MIPVLATDRRTLRGPVREDGEACAAVFADPVRATGPDCGDVGLLHPPRDPEPEIGWTPEAEGRGIAFEAATAARARAHLAGTSLASRVDPGNARSIRLGARREGAAPGDVPGDIVFRLARPEPRR
jgi:RimJ/RimL family protein N-acetyltransferase